jgi:hypothetical protein
MTYNTSLNIHDFITENGRIFTHLFIIPHFAGTTIPYTILDPLGAYISIMTNYVTIWYEE